MSKKNRFIHEAMKNVTRNGDAKKLDYIQNNIDTRFLHLIREQEIIDSNFLTTFANRIPDFIINKDVIGELDSVKIHGELGFENKNTLRRNTDYLNAGRPFFVVNEDLAKRLGLDQAKLFEYMYWHTKMYMNALKEIGDTTFI